MAPSRRAAPIGLAVDVDGVRICLVGELFVAEASV
jgi:hypothetical protein